MLKIWLYKFLIRYIPDSIWIRLQFRRKFGRWPNLKNPRTFSEKIQWLKLHDRNPLYSKLVDKYEVKRIVAKKIGEEYIIPTLGVWDEFDDIDFEKLPRQFVLKCTHDSGGLVVVKDKLKMDVKTARKVINRCLKMNYYWALREWPYKNVKPRIIAEQYMEDESGYELKDYKVFCFNGTPRALFIATDRGKHETKFDFFDADLNHLPMKQHYPNNPNIKIPDPEGVKKMFELAKILTKEFKHCRADFYDVNGKIYFGELTFSHFSGMQPMEPMEWDEKFGSWLNLVE